MVNKNKWHEIRCVCIYYDDSKLRIKKFEEVISLFKEELEHPSVTAPKKLEKRRETVTRNLIKAEEQLASVKGELKTDKKRVINLLDNYRCKGWIKLETPADIRALWKCTHWNKERIFRYGMCLQPQTNVADAVIESHQRWFGIGAAIKHGYLYELKGGKVQFAKDETATKFGFEVPNSIEKRSLNKLNEVKENHIQYMPQRLDGI